MIRKEKYYYTVIFVRDGKEITRVFRTEYSAQLFIEKNKSLRYV